MQAARTAPWAQRVRAGCGAEPAATGECPQPVWARGWSRANGSGPSSPRGTVRGGALPSRGRTGTAREGAARSRGRALSGQCRAVVPVPADGCCSPEVATERVGRCSTNSFVHKCRPRPQRAPQLHESPVPAAAVPLSSDPVCACCLSKGQQCSQVPLAGCAENKLARASLWETLSKLPPVLRRGLAFPGRQGLTCPLTSTGSSGVH